MTTIMASSGQKMDPLSITAASLSILKVCVTLCSEVKEFIEGVNSAPTLIGVLLQEVKDFEKSLKSLEEFLEDDRTKDTIQSGGNVSRLWTDLKVCLDDARVTMESLKITMSKINKSVTILDSARKHIRLQSASKRIQMFQQQLRSSKYTIIVTLQTAIVLVTLLTIKKTQLTCFS
jgi:hypothetical protein